jgi:hypothetical protein
MLPRGEAKIPLRSVKHKILYDSLVRDANRRQADRNRLRVTPLLNRSGSTEGEETRVLESIWRGSRSKEFLPKASDFIWRMLHGRNIYGDGLKGALEENGGCDECGVVCTELHLLIECPVAKTLWECRRTLWKRMAGNLNGFCPTPKSINELKLTLCRPRARDVNDRRRHLILTSLIVWVLWKAGTQKWYDGKQITKEGVVTTYLELILEQIHVDRIEAASPRFRGRMKKLDDRFLRIWGFPRSQMTIGGSPKCLRAGFKILS